jgi:hypothetical protein
VISNENEVDDEDEDDDAATHVLPSKDVLGETDLAELAERARRHSRPRTAPPPIPSRVPPAAPPRPHAVAPEPAWAEEEDYNETLTYGEQADDDQLPTAIPPQAQHTVPDAPAAGHFYPGSLGSVAPRRAYEPAPVPFDRAAVSPQDMRPLAHPPASDLATKLLLGLIVLLAVALAVVLVLIVRR